MRRGAGIEERQMSAYEVNKILYRLHHAPAFLEEFRADPRRAIEGVNLTDQERTAFLSGDVATLSRLGAHDFLLGNFPRFQLLGMTRDAYQQRMRALLENK
jgi:hypothetical protein